MRRYLLICLAIFGLLIFGQNVLAADWQLSTIDSATVGADNAIAVDSNDYVHVAYVDFASYDLLYATNKSGAWVSTIVDSTGDVGNGVSLKIDSNDKVHVSYIDSTNNYLKYATNAAGTWTTAIADNTGNIDVAWGGITSLDIASNNVIGISYYDSVLGDLKYANNGTGAWVLTTVDSTGSVGTYNSLGIDSNGYEHIGYFDDTNNTLKYVVRNTNNTWTIETLENNVAGGIALALDANNKVHISYQNASFNLKYITNISGSWVSTVLDTGSQTGYCTSIMVDSNNAPRIGYYDGTNSTFKYATNISGTWITTKIDDIGPALFAWLFGYYNLDSIALDSQNRVYFSYFEGNNNDLKLAYTPGPSDQTTTINSGRSYSAKKKIHITSSLTGSPTEMIVSTKSDFSDKTWKTYTADKTFEMPSTKGKNIIYVKYRDVWNAESDVVSAEVKYTGSPIKFVTTKAKAKKEKRITEKNKNYYARDLYLKFKKYPKSFKNTRRYIEIGRELKYPSTYVDAKNNLLKKYWKITTDFAKYKSGDKVRLKLVFQYSDSEFDKLKKKVKKLKEKKLYLKYYVSESGSWVDLQVKPNTTDNTFTIYLDSPFNYSERYYAIGR